MIGSNWTLRFPRTGREAGLHDTPIHQEREPAWYAVVGYTCLGVILSWLFLVVVLGGGA